MGFFFEIYIRLFYQRVFVDQIGNEYFLSHNKNYLGVYRRYVIFNKKNIYQDTSIITPASFLWLHYLIDDFNDKIFTDRKSWYKSNHGNLTGTSNAHNPYCS